MTDEEIIKRAKEAGKRTEFSSLVTSSKSKGVNSPYGIGFIDGMVEYRESMWHKPKERPERKDDKGRDKHILVLCKDGRLKKTWPIIYHEEECLTWAYVIDLLPSGVKYESMY